MNRQHTAAAVRNLYKTENNNVIVYNVLKQNGGTMSTKEIQTVIGWCGFTVRKSLRHLVQAGSVEEIRHKLNMHNGCGFIYKATDKPYVMRTKEEIEATYDWQSNKIGFGSGSFDMPWMPKVPQVDAKPQTFKLLDTKDADYFHAPLKKSKPISIGSTFSLFDGVTA